MYSYIHTLPPNSMVWDPVKSLWVISSLVFFTVQFVTKVNGRKASNTSQPLMIMDDVGEREAGGDWALVIITTWGRTSVFNGDLLTRLEDLAPFMAPKYSFLNKWTLAKGILGDHYDSNTWSSSLRIIVSLKGGELYLGLTWFCVRRRT